MSVPRALQYFVTPHPRWRTPPPFTISTDDKGALFSLDWTEENLQRIQDPFCPIYHAWPGGCYSTRATGETYDERMARSLREAVEPGRTPIASIQPLSIDYNSQLHQPLLERLRYLVSTPAPYGSSRAVRTAQWRAVHPPNQPLVWGRGGLGTILDESLFAVVEAILGSLYAGLSIESQGSLGQSALRTHHGVLEDSEFFHVTWREPQGSDKRRVAMVILVVPWLDRRTCQYMRDTTGPPHRVEPDTASLSSGEAQAAQQRALQKVRCLTLGALAREMLVTDAIFGAIYTGADLLVFERDLDLPEAQQVQASTHAYIPVVNGDAPNAQPPSEPSLALRNWTTAFSHPWDPRSPLTDKAFVKPNPAWALAAIIVYAVDKLGQPGRNRSATEAGAARTSQHAPDATAGAEYDLGLLPHDVDPSLEKYDERHELPSFASKLQFLCATLSHPYVELGSATGSPRAEADLLVASGLTEALQPYVLVMDAQPSGYGSTCHVHRGTLYTFADLSSLPPWLSWRATPAKLGKEDPAQAQARPNYLYRAQGSVAREVRAHVAAAEAAGAFRTPEAVVLKLPLLPIQDPNTRYPYSDSDSDEDEDEDEDSRYEPEREELCWNNVPLDFHCGQCKESLYARPPPGLLELSHILSTEHRAYAALSPSACAILPKRPLTLRLALRGDVRTPPRPRDEPKATWQATWAAYTARPHPLWADAGVALGDIALFVLDRARLAQGEDPQYYPLAAPRRAVAEMVRALRGWSPAEGRENVLEVRRQAAERLRRMHEGRFLHGDVHAGNVCLKWVEEEEGEEEEEGREVRPVRGRARARSESCPDPRKGKEDKHRVRAGVQVQVRVRQRAASTARPRRSSAGPGQAASVSDVAAAQQLRIPSGVGTAPEDASPPASRSRLVVTLIDLSESTHFPPLSAAAGLSYSSRLDAEHFVQQAAWEAERLEEALGSLDRAMRRLEEVVLVRAGRGEGAGKG